MEENYLNVTLDEFLIVTEVRAGTVVGDLPSGAPNVIEGLFQPLEQTDPYVAPPVPLSASTRLRHLRPVIVSISPAFALLGSWMATARRRS